MKDGGFKAVISREDHPFRTALLKLAAFLIILQLVRAGVMYGEYFIIRPDGSESIWSFTCILNFLIVGAALLFIYCPSADSMSACWTDIKSGHKKLYAAAGIFTLLLIGTSVLIDTNNFIKNASAAIMTPIFEELIFRGWAWKNLENTVTGKYSKLIILLTTSALFGLWHLGYVDYLLLKVMPGSTDISAMALTLLYKVLLGFVIGLLTGFLRLKTGKVYGSIILHALINIFGR